MLFFACVLVCLSAEAGHMTFPGAEWERRSPERLGLDAAALDTVTGLATAWDAGVSGTIFSISTLGPTVYLGGAFSVNAEPSQLRLVAVDTHAVRPEPFRHLAEKAPELGFPSCAAYP